MACRVLWPAAMTNFKSKLLALAIATLGCHHPAPPQQRTTDPKVLRESLTVRLEASGVDRDSEQAAGALRAILETRAALEGGTIEIDEPTCYHAGCLAPVRISGEFPEQQHVLARSLRTHWHGELYITGPEPSPNGVSECSLAVLF
jgi:hypothetical protein